MRRLSTPIKEMRAHVVARHVNRTHQDVVVFSCGNAATYLQRIIGQRRVLAIAPGMDLRAERWWTPADIAATWPDRFDATSGHLPMPMMAEVAIALAGFMRSAITPGESYIVPTGSGETVLCLRWAFPRSTFVAEYGSSPATKYEPLAPLNAIVAFSGPVTNVERQP